MKRRSILPGISLWLAGVAIVATTTCSSATPTETPGVDRLGATILRYRGPEMDTILSSRAANFGIGGDWLFLDVAITGNSRESVEVKREKIAVRVPSGDIIPLATQQEFGEAYPQLAAAIQRANVAEEPLDYYMGRRIESLSFLTLPGDGLSLSSQWVNDQVVYVGRLYFLVPSGVQAGRYELRIDLPESKVRIPFRLGERQVS